MVVAAPLGLGAAIYLSEYAKPKVRSVLKPILEVLAGIPSVVVGVLRPHWIAPSWSAGLFGEATTRARCSPPASASAS